MKLALDTYRDVASGDPDRRTHAVFTFAMWFAAGGFFASVLSDHLTILESTASNVIGGVLVSALVAFVKIT